jgi:hypothetical protein
MADLVRFHVFYQTEFDEDQIGTKGAVAEGFQSFAAAQKEAKRIFTRDKKSLVITQTNPRRRHGAWHQVRMHFG